MNFISGVTMSAEEARREAQEKDAAQQTAAAENERHERVGSWESGSRHRTSAHLHHNPPIPDYLPPPPSANRSGALSPSQEVTIERAEYQAEKTVRQGAREEEVPDRVLQTTSAPPTMGSATVPVVKHSQQNAGPSANLPVVDEAAEVSSTTVADQSRSSHISSATADSDGRPLTPAKDGMEKSAGFGNSSLRGGKSYPPHPNGPPPPTPPKTGYGNNLKPESADSGYGVAGSGALKSGGGSMKSLDRKNSISRESLDKELPPLPGMI